MAGKRKRLVLGLDQKLEIIKRLRKGETATSLAQIYGVGRTTVNDIKRDAEKIEQHVSMMQRTDGNVKSRKTMKPAKYEQLDNAMYQWFIQARSQGIPLTGPIIMTKAGEMNKKLDADLNFKASVGWLDKFKFRHGIRQLDISGEKLSANGEIIDEFKNLLSSKISDLNLVKEQVYNCDETGLNWKALPRKTLASLTEKTAPGFKMQKDRITVMVCANATGSHRLPLLVIGKSKKPRAFKNIHLNALPVNYYAQKNAWMDQTIFSEWFHKMFVPEVKTHLAEKQLPQEALLLMDNAPTHPPSDALKSDDGKIICLFLPANTTPLIQPMDQGIIENMKRRYRKNFIESLLSSDDAMTVKEFWKNYNIKDAIYNVASAWTDITVSNLKNGWNKIWPEKTSAVNVNDEETESVSVEEIMKICNNFNSETLTKGEIKDWLECDQEDEILNDEEIIANVTATEKIDDDDEDYVSGLDQKQTITNSEAELMLTKCIDWFENQEEATGTQILLLRKIRNLATQKARISNKQKKMTDYFVK